MKKILPGKSWLWTGYAFHKFVIRGSVLKDVQYKTVPEKEDQKGVHHVVPDRIKKIDKDAFRHDEIPAAITLPDGLVTIDEEAFSCCFELKTINIPATVTQIGDGAFWFCEKIKIAVDKKNPRYKIVGRCLVDMKDKKLIAIMPSSEPTIPEFVTEIGAGFVCNAKRLKKLTIPDGIKALPNYAFHMCKKLEELILPKSLERIGYGAFQRCERIIIKAPAGSFAIQYAKENGLKYEEI